MNELEAAKLIKKFGLYHALQNLPDSETMVKAFEMAISALLEKSQSGESQWTKVDPYHMPPQNVVVLGTMRWCNDVSTVPMMFSPYYRTWEVCEPCETGGYNTHPISESTEVTHWMPYPAPAQD